MLLSQNTFQNNDLRTQCHYNPLYNPFFPIRAAYEPKSPSLSIATSYPKMPNVASRLGGRTAVYAVCDFAGDSGGGPRKGPPTKRHLRI